MDTDVLVVGAGPTGLMLANQLGRSGVRALIIDRHSGLALQTRAMAVQARTLEIYAKLGIADRALELGKRGTGANMWSEGRRMARIPLGNIGTGLSPFPFVLMLGQDDNERLMGDHLRNWPRRPRRTCRDSPGSRRRDALPRRVLHPARERSRCRDMTVRAQARSTCPLRASVSAPSMYRSSPLTIV